MTSLSPIETVCYSRFSVDGDIIMRYDMDADGKLSDYCEDETPWGENDKVLKPFDQPVRLIIS